MKNIHKHMKNIRPPGETTDVVHEETANTPMDPDGVGESHLHKNTLKTYSTGVLVTSK